MINDIRKLEVKDYEDVIQEVIAFLSKYKMVKSVYQIGGVSAPGISDLDLIIILDEKAKKFTQVWSDYMKQQSENSDYVFTHYPFLVNEEIFKDGSFLKIFPTFNLKCLYGQRYNIQLEYTEQDQISNFLDANLPFWYSEFKHNNIESIRQNLLRLHSLVYPITMIKNIANYEDENIIQFVIDIKELRFNIFNRNNLVIVDAINRLVKVADKISIVINKVMSNFIKEKLDNLNLNFKVSINDPRYSVSNFGDSNYLNSYLLINAYIYSIKEYKLKKYISKSISITNIDADNENLTKLDFYNELEITYTNKIDIYDNYIYWIQDNQLGWGVLSTPLFNSFLSYFCTEPEFYNNKIKHFVKMLLSNYRFSR